MLELVVRLVFCVLLVGWLIIIWEDLVGVLLYKVSVMLVVEFVMLVLGLIVLFVMVFIFFDIKFVEVVFNVSG